MFGRRRRRAAAEQQADQAAAATPEDAGDGLEAADGAPVTGADDTAGADAATGAEAPADDGPADPVHDGSDGPFDEDAVDNLDELLADETFLNLGSVLVPIPDGGQVQVELAQTGAVNNVFIAVAGGRIAINAFAAPRSPGQWRTVVTELSESLRGEGAQVAVEQGPWGREVHGRAKTGDLRFIGVDGPRWMVRCVVVGKADTVGADTDLVAVAREVLRGTVVRRGGEPMPVRTPLKVTLPKSLADKLAGAQQEAAAKHQRAQQENAMRQLAARQAQMRQALGATGERTSDAERAAAGAAAAEPTPAQQAEEAPAPQQQTPAQQAPGGADPAGGQGEAPAALRRNPQGSALQQLGKRQQDKKTD